MKKINYIKKIQKAVHQIDKLEAKLNGELNHQRKHWLHYTIGKIKSRINLYCKFNCKQMQDAKLERYTDLINEIIIGVK